MPLNLQKVKNKYKRIIEFHEGIIRIPTTELDIKITQSAATGNIKAKVIIPLIEHPFHGNTRIEVLALYTDNDNEPNTYNYAWKFDQKGGVQTVHISAWGKESHPNMGLKTDPYHHHHVPLDRPKRKECYYVRDLDSVMTFVGDLIKGGVPYNQIMNT